MITIDRQQELRAIEAQGAASWTDQDINRLADAYCYSDGSAALKNLWIRVLCLERENALLRARVETLTWRTTK